MVIMIKGRLKKWGNSFGVIIPREIVESENFRENQEIEFLLVKKQSSEKVLKETFGMLRGRFKKTAQEMKDELRDELYDDD